MVKVLLSSLDIGDCYQYTDNGFGHDINSSNYRIVEYYGQVVGIAPLLSKPKSIPVIYGKKDYRPFTGKVFIDDCGDMTRVSLSNDLLVEKVKLI